MLRIGSGSDSSRRKKHELMRQGERGCLSGVGVGESSAPTAGPEGLLGDGVPEQNELRPHRLHRLLRSSAPDSKRKLRGILWEWPLGWSVVSHPSHQPSFVEQKPTIYCIKPN